MTRFFLISILACACALAQPVLYDPSAKGAVDFSGATSSKPAPVGTSLPATCAVGQLYYKSDATAGQNLYACTSLNAWTQQGGAGVITAVQAGLSGGVTASTSTGTVTVDIDTAVVPRLAVSNDFTGQQKFSGGHQGKTITGTPAANSITCSSGNDGLELFQKDATTGSNKWVCDGASTTWKQQGGSTVTTIAALTGDVAITTPVANNILKYNSGTSKWENVASTRTFSTEYRFAQFTIGASPQQSGGWSAIGANYTGVTGTAGPTSYGDGVPVTGINLGVFRFLDEASTTRHLYNAVTIPPGFVSANVKLKWTIPSGTAGQATDLRTARVCLADDTDGGLSPTWTESSFSNVNTPNAAGRWVTSTVSNFATATGACVAGNMMLFRVSRYAADTFGGNVDMSNYTIEWTVQ